MITYWIEINVARRGATPHWWQMVGHHDEELVWHSVEEVRAAFAREARSDARIMSCVEGDFSPVYPTAPCAHS